MAAPSSPWIACSAARNQRRARPINSIVSHQRAEDLSAGEINYVVAILVPVVAGLFALLGAFAGSRLARGVEYEKWLRENRSIAFAKFLEQLAAARKSATEALFDGSLEEVSRDIKVTGAYFPVEEYSRVIALYLPSDKRQQFRTLTREFIALHSQPSLGNSRIATMEARLEEIQKLFEEQL